MSKQKQSVHDNAMARTLMEMLARNEMVFMEVSSIMNTVLMWGEAFSDRAMTLESISEITRIDNVRLVELVLELMGEAGVASFKSADGELEITYADPTDDLVWWRVHRAFMAEELGWGHLYTLLAGMAIEMGEVDYLERTPDEISELSGGAPYEELAKRFDDLQRLGFFEPDAGADNLYIAGPGWRPPRWFDLRAFQQEVLESPLRSMHKIVLFAIGCQVDSGGRALVDLEEMYGHVGAPAEEVLAALEDLEGEWIYVLRGKASTVIKVTRGFRVAGDGQQ